MKLGELKFHMCKNEVTIWWIVKQKTCWTFCGYLKIPSTNRRNPIKKRSNWFSGEPVQNSFYYHGRCGPYWWLGHGQNTNTDHGVYVIIRIIIKPRRRFRGNHSHLCRRDPSGRGWFFRPARSNSLSIRNSVSCFPTLRQVNVFISSWGLHSRVMLCQQYTYSKMIFRFLLRLWLIQCFHLSIF